MEREDKYLLGCLFVIHKLQEKGSTEFAVKVDGKWETISWKEICDWIEKQYAIGEDEKNGRIDSSTSKGVARGNQRTVGSTRSRPVQRDYADIQRCGR